MPISPEKRKQYAQKYKEDGRAIESQRKSRYGLEKGDFASLLEKQKNLCLVCEEPFDEEHTPTAVDHDHETKKVRGLLHRKCNSMLGLAKDDPNILERAAKYLRDFSVQIVDTR